MKPQFVSHTPPEGSNQWHELKQHLRDVADGTYRYADKFGAGKLGKYAGLWHDLGKYNPEFQVYLEQCHAASQVGSKQKPRGPRHAIHGAMLAAEVCPPLATIIYGHHAGLPNFADLKAALKDPTWQASYQQAFKIAQNDLGSLKPSIDLQTTLKNVPRDELGREVFLRMLFSCLVDADYLDTEEHFEAANTAVRGSKFSVNQLWDAFEQKRREFLTQLEDPNMVVNKVREQVYQACFTSAEWKPGVFRLAVPTGGGKTLSGLAFALRHAVLHKCDRVIVAVPYTSIIEQTVKVYRDLFEHDAVLEHHSAVKDDYVRDDRKKGNEEEQFQSDDGAMRSQAQARLATQNWDAPLVVTTTVQLFESLFANRTSRCRKLHNIIGSVIILDEVQTLPIALLTPIRSMLQELVERYRVTVVFCTATQPPIEGQNPYFDGFPSELIRNIIEPEQAKQHFKALQRVHYEKPSVSWSWEDVAQDIKPKNQALVVLNTRKNALSVLDALEVRATDYLSGSNHQDEVQSVLRESDILHLSTLLCGEHRREVLAEVRQRLKARKPCILISTQVVEAGVDVDFPIVYRAMGPLDRIVQAAGRCNREGKMEGKGRVVIFEATEGKTPKGEYGKAVAMTRQHLNEAGLEGLHEPDIFEAYFQSLYQIEDRDKHGIEDLRKQSNYRCVAEKFRLIDDNSMPVVIRYNDEVTQILNEISRRGLWSSDRRKLQPYIVNLPRYEFLKMTTRTEWVPNLWVWDGTYDPIRGTPIGQDPGDALYDPDFLNQ
jgi:CRISPR-associated endonuclease/helicase Cas3